MLEERAQGAKTKLHIISLSIVTNPSRLIIISELEGTTMLGRKIKKYKNKKKEKMKEEWTYQEIISFGLTLLFQMLQIGNERGA